jgi:tRNA(adenine34) deaminase
MISDVRAMELALAEAAEAAAVGDVPVGAVILMDGEVISSAHNEKELEQEPTAHAEILAIRRAVAKTGSWRLEGATLVVTLEPCVMCAGAIVAARIPRLVFGAYDPKAGATGSLYNVCDDPRLNHQCEIVGGVEREACGEVLKKFFVERRAAASGEL